VTKEQGLITEEGYEEQAQSYRIMQGAAEQAAAAEKKSAPTSRPASRSRRASPRSSRAST
jgi:hypothetical protein